MWRYAPILATALALLGAPGEAFARKQIVVLQFAGQDARRMADSIRNALAEEHAMIPARKYQEAAAELDALDESGRDVVTVCREIGCDAVVGGELRETRRGFVLELRLLDGNTGELKKRLLMRLKRPRLTEKLARGLRERLSPSLDEVEAGDQFEESEGDGDNEFRESFGDEVEVEKAERSESDEADEAVDSASGGGGLSGMLDIAGYYDNRGTTDLTLNAFVNLSSRFSYYGFVSLKNDSEKTLIDQNTYFSQQSLYFVLSKNLPFDATGMIEFVSGNDNDAIRLGARWRVSDTGFLKDAMASIRLTYGVSLFPLQFDYLTEKSYRAFISHSYYADIVPGRVYLSGYADHALALVKAAPAGMAAPAPGATPAAPGATPGMMTATPGGLKHMIATEHQLGVRLFAGLHGVLELRHDPYLTEKKTGVGIGLQYVVPFEYKP